MKQRVYVANFAFLLAVAVWTLGWAATLMIAARQITLAKVASLVSVGLATVFTTVGVLVMVRLALCIDASARPEPTQREPWFQRITGWFAAFVWCVASIAWNVSVIATLIRMASEGRGWMLLFLTPWSLIGLFLMSVLFVGIGLLIDLLLNLTRR